MYKDQDLMLKNCSVDQFTIQEYYLFLLQIWLKMTLVHFDYIEQTMCQV